MTGLVLSGVSKTHPGSLQPTIDGLSLTVPAGGLTALLGPSGAGKTTVMRMIAGLISPDSGDIRLNGRTLLALPPERRGVVMVFQNALLFPHLTLAENVGFGLRMRGLPAIDIATRVEAMLHRVQLSGLGHRRPAELSGGQEQRGALARALVLKPDLLLLDEPLSNLDAGLRDDMRQLIRDLQRDTGTTMLVVTHDQSEAVALADRVALLLDGRLAQEAAPWEIYRRPASVAVARFFGGVNFLHGRMADGGFDCALGRVQLATDALPEQAGRPATRAAILTIRPEAVRIGPPGDGHAAKVLATAFLGTQSRVELGIGDQRLIALTSPEAASALTPGAAVTVVLPADALWVIPTPEGQTPAGGLP